MVRLGKKAKIEPVREANEVAVENEYKNEEVKAEGTVKDLILADAKRQALANEWAGYSAKLSVSEIEAILNKYYA